MTTFFWDFIGPRAEQIAAHHVTHVNEFLAREKLDGCQSGVTKAAQFRCTAWVKAPAEVAPLIARALKPPRSG